MHEKRIFSKDVVRQISVLEMLYQNDGIEIEKLISVLKLERRIIYKCIEQLQQQSADHLLEIEIFVSSRGKYIFKGNKKEYYKLRAFIIDNEPITQLAKVLVQHTSVDFSQFCSSNYMSESTLKRYLRKVNTLLDPLGLRLCVCKKQISFKGPELKVRYCLLTFFWRYYHGLVWPFDGIEEKSILQLLDELISSCVDISYGKKKQLGYLFAVYILRSESGVLLSKSDFPQYFEYYVHENPVFKTFLEKVQNRFNQREIEIGALFFSLYIFPESYPYIQDSPSSLKILEKCAPLSYDSIMNFVKFVKVRHPEYKIYLEDSNQFLDAMIAGRIFVDAFGCLYFNMSLIAVFKYAEENFPNLLPSISKVIKEYEPNLSSNLLKTLAFRYAQAYILEFSPRDFELQIKILLDTDVSAYEDKLIIEKISHLLAPRFNFEWVTLKKMNMPDLIITTCEVEEKFSNISQVIINGKLTAKDTLEVIKNCEKIFNEKNKEKHL